MNAYNKDIKFPLLVNKSHPLPKNYVPNDLICFPNTSYLACSQTVTAFLKLQSDALTFNHHISILSAYRSIEFQTILYLNYLTQDPQEIVDTYCAHPGYSEHHTGYALDVCVTDHELDTFEATPESIWLNNHAHQYGFIIRYPKDCTAITGYCYEPWHITYVGTEVSNLMKQQHIATLEEFIKINTLY